MRCYVVIFLAFCLSLPGCASTSGASRSPAGNYRCGTDPDNAEYLSLRSNGTYISREVSTSVNGQEIAPTEVSRGTGRWTVQSHEVILTLKHAAAVRLTIMGRDASEGLRQVYGAGWIPPYQFVRISAAENEAHPGPRLPRLH